MTVKPAFPEEETCSLCRRDYPAPLGLNHSETECLTAQVAEARDVAEHYRDEAVKCGLDPMDESTLRLPWEIE